MCSFIVLMASVRIYNVNSHENEGKALNEKVCLNFWPVLLHPGPAKPRLLLLLSVPAAGVRYDRLNCSPIYRRTTHHRVLVCSSQFRVVLLLYTPACSALPSSFCVCMESALYYLLITSLLVFSYSGFIFTPVYLLFVLCASRR